MNFFEKRRLAKTARLTIQQAIHVVNMRGDLMEKGDVSAIKHHAVALSDAMKARDHATLHERLNALAACLERHTLKHPVRGGALRENFEVLVVAVAVAMGLRAYFIQPFKIPTGSMQPTLYGITATSNVQPSVADRFPFNLVKFAITGDWYSVRKAKAGGTLGHPLSHPTDPSVAVFRIGGGAHAIPSDALRQSQGTSTYHPLRRINVGDVLWAGVTHRGDHLFVNKVIWNFRKPRRDEVMVFTTDGIEGLEPGTHYIKRMCGMPNETLSIDPPYLVINGERMSGLRGIDKVTAAQGLYSGYQWAGDFDSVHSKCELGPDAYFAMGDNTRNSKDSRYWGTVPSRNLVGPAVVVYWPFTRRWGLIR